MFDRKVFCIPIAHRGLHDLRQGVIENTAPAFEAAIAKGHGIECDLRPALDGTPMVFHDLPLGRLIDARGKISDFRPSDLARLAYKNSDTRILTFADLLDLVGGRVPILVEIKSEWTEPDAAFLKAIVKLVKKYKGPIATMSFDPALMAVMRELVPKVPRGIVSGQYKGDGWWLDTLDPDQAFRLTHLLDSRPAEPHFFAYHVKALPTPVTRFAREVAGFPLFGWTVRTALDLATAAKWCDAPIYETIAIE
jgi:glycerophosphoryl diester phosphodiesterase